MKADPAVTPTDNPAEDVRFLTAIDVGRQAGCHANTAKQVAEQLRIPIAQTVRGCRLFTPKQADSIAAEVERRRKEDKY